MDKRTLIFAIAAFAALFAVNTYFKWQHEDQVLQWNTEQRFKKTEKLQSLESKIATETATLEELPLVTIYQDSQGTTLLGEAVLTGNALFTISLDSKSPDTVYTINEEKKAEKYTLLQGTSQPQELLIYQSEAKKPLVIGSLPDIGNEELQVLYFENPKQNIPTRVELATYSDGLFNLASETLENLKLGLDPNYKKEILPKDTGLVLINSKERYQPVGIYQGRNKNFIPLEDIVSVENKTSTSLHTEQEFYVLENDYVQLVFSNVGGALAEINLPFHSGNDLASVVKPIEIDRDMQINHPYNAHFPAHPYFTPGETPTGPFVKNPEGPIGGYYPLIRRDLVETGNWDSVSINPRYYALNLISEQPEVAELLYKVKYFDKTTLTLEAEQRRRKITKTFSLQKEQAAPYCFDLTIKIDGDRRGLWLSSGVPEVELFSGNPEPVLKYRITRNQKPVIEVIPLPKETTTNSSIQPDWLCNSNGFFGIIMDPLNDVSDGFKAIYVPGQTVPSRLVEVDQAYNHFPAETLPGYLLSMPIRTNQKALNYRIFAGPFSDSVLKAVDKIYSDPATDYTPDYIASQSWHGFFSVISEPFARFLFVLMKFFYSLTHSWGFSIILLTVALRIMMYPLNAWSTKSMLKMQQIAPEVAAIQERNKKDPKKAQIEIMKLYSEKGANPFSGCLPLLIQMPFLIGMFDLLKTTFELRGASFIPGWIDNLSAPDVLFSWGTPIFFIGNEFHLLPFLLGGVMFLQQRMSTPAIDPDKMTDQQRQQKTMMAFMPILFTFMFYHFPSGLNIYWLSSMLLGMLQQWWTQKRLAKEAAKPTVIVPKLKK